MYMPLLNILGAISGVITVLETYFREQKCITAIGTLSNSELYLNSLRDERLCHDNIKYNVCSQRYNEGLLLLSSYVFLDYEFE